MSVTIRLYVYEGVEYNTVVDDGLVTMLFNKSISKEEVKQFKNGYISAKKFYNKEGI